MKEKLSEPKQRLLNDVLGDASADSAKRQALAVFRRARWSNRLALAAPLAAVFIFLGAGLWLFRPSGPATSGSPVATAAAGASGSTPIRTLTDEELIATFPPNSCFIAEVDGRKTLVFADPNLRKKYLH